ncbi:MAG: EamA family transporter RarD [Actinobacteria bacterium]|nr:EamA family transporter RarD [Actinomycetota bacterium]
MPDGNSSTTKGTWQAVAAYSVWGLFPFYWKALSAVPSSQLVAHRIAWSFVLLSMIIVARGQAGTLRRAVAQPKSLLAYLTAAIVLSVNWLIYVWAVTAGFIVESSLGYFINPLFSVLLGVVVLRERLRPVQWVAIALAVAGVATLTVEYGRLPWIALALASTFAVYGLVKKLAPLGTVVGLGLETGLVFIPAVVYLALAERAGAGAFLHSNATTTALLVGAGLVTTVPLLLFSSATKRIPLSVVGLLQYINPTIQFLIGVLVYHETVSKNALLGFGAVWVALALFAGEALLRRAPVPVVAE